MTAPSKDFLIFFKHPRSSGTTFGFMGDLTGHCFICYNTPRMSDEILTPTENNQQSGYPAEASREMMEAGVFYGRKKSKTNPKMRQFVLGNRGGIELINLQKSEELVKEAAEFVKEKVKKGALVLLVGTMAGSEEGVTRIAQKFNLPYVTIRWVGGAITNFGNISKRVEYMVKLRTDIASGALGKYTKKERLEMEREMERLRILMGGLESMTRVPDVMIVIDPILHKTAVAEAIVKKIPIIALANVDANPDDIDYLVPGNDKAKRSIEWFLGKMEEAIDEGLKEKARIATEIAAAAAKTEDVKKLEPAKE
jgi:small subunit ribosomal protein S2